jgi:hypothetical protein
MQGYGSISFFYLTKKGSEHTIHCLSVMEHIIAENDFILPTLLIENLNRYLF